MNKKLLVILLFVFGLVGVLLRVYHIEFGLPHSFYADEPEIAEPAINITYEIKNVLKNNDFYKFIPVSYVYGTFPTYLLTGFLMIFSKSMGLMHIQFDKTVLYIGLRSFQALLSMIIPVTGSLLSYKLSKSRNVSLWTFIILALNWKLIVHAHYINGDIFLTGIYTATLYLLYKYYEQGPDNKYTVLSALVFGLTYGTKITALLALPAILFLFVKKKDLFGFFGFIFTSLITFIATNPFSILFINDFLYRILTMGTKEAGMVFDSVNYNPLKGIYGLVLMLGIPIMVLAIYGISKVLRQKDTFNTFLIFNVLVYVAFFSLQPRRVDRWLMPIIPILAIYCAIAWETIMKKIRSVTLIGIILLTGISSFPNTIHLLNQFKRYTPKAEAYMWMQKNADPLKTKLVITEEGLDPMNKLPMASVIQYEVYESQGAYLAYPPDLTPYTYVVLSSRPMQNFKNRNVSKKYPDYSSKWAEFEQKVSKSNEYKMIKGFESPKPNLIPLSDVYIYEKK